MFLSEMSADKVYELFDEKIFNLTNGFKKPPPLFVKQESKGKYHVSRHCVFVLYALVIFFCYI